MSVVRVRKKRGDFAVIHTGFLEDPQLSAKAKGILAYLLSKPDNWTAKQYQVERVMADGRASIAAGFRELIAAGYMRRWWGNDPETGHLHLITEVFETPQACAEAQAPDEASDEPEQPDDQETEDGEPERGFTERRFSADGLSGAGFLDTQNNNDSTNASLSSSTSKEGGGGARARAREAPPPAPPPPPEERVLNTLKRIAPEVARQYGHRAAEWAHLSDRQLEEAWELSHPRHWVSTPRAAKRRTWNFLDLLADEIIPPRAASASPAARAVAELRARYADLLGTS